MASTSIYVLTLGKHRPIALTIAGVLAPHNYHVSGILSSQTYSSSELALALRVLNPLPRVLLVGGGYTDEEADQAKEVFKEYAKEVEVADGTVVRVGPGVLDKVGRDGVGKWIVGELDEWFGRGGK